MRLIQGLALAAVPVAILIGAVVSVSPFLGLTAGLLAALLVTVVVTRDRAVLLFLVALTVLLIGYVVFGRGIAHLGVPPVYIGEVVLALAIPAMVVSLPRVRFGPPEIAILLFMSWGLVRTIPYIATYEFDSLRDAAIWGYAAFALAVAWIVRPGHFRPLVRLYRPLVPVLILWIPVSALLVATVIDQIPFAPGSEVPIVFFKPGDAGVHLAGAAAFLLVGLYSAVRPASTIHEVLLWAGWVFGVAVAGAINRGGLFAASVIVAATLFVRSSARWLALVMVTSLLLALAAIANPSLTVPGRDREVSVQQLTSNVLSVVFDTGTSELANTRNWRLEWWDEIIDYTVNGPLFWEGKGFGVNLADDDGFQVNQDKSLRSPHSSHFSLLARSGVVGLVLWLLVLAAFAWTVVRAALRARGAGRTLWVAVLGWIFVYWTAALINSSFDVYLEGPQGGIWFWALYGLGIAASRSWTETLDVADDQRSADTPADRRIASRSASVR